MHTLKVISCSIALLVVFTAAAVAQNSTVAPMQMRGLMPVVEVKINGQGPFAFMIDTGAGMQADIDISVAQRLGLPVSGTAINGDPSGENDREVATVRLNSIVIGGQNVPASGTRARRISDSAGLEFSNVTAIVRPHKITQDYPDVDGILGFALFSDYLLTLDYPAMQVKLARGALAEANTGDILNFELENHIPVVELGIGKIRVPAHIDSGNFVAGFILPEEIVEQLPLLSQPVAVGRARSVSNRISLKQVQLRDTIRIGGFEYPQATVVFPAPAETNIGFNVLREFALTFDQKNRRIKLERSH